jgi:hypothetical protein
VRCTSNNKAEPLDRCVRQQPRSDLAEYVEGVEVLRHAGLLCKPLTDWPVELWVTAVLMLGAFQMYAVTATKKLFNESASVSFMLSAADCSP